MTGKPFQSKLRPHLEFIRECRAKEMSYPRIAAELRTHFGLAAAPSTIFAFVKVRARNRSVFSLPPGDNAAAAPACQERAVSRPPNPRISAPSNWLNYDPDKPLEKLSPT